MLNPARVNPDPDPKPDADPDPSRDPNQNLACGVLEGKPAEEAAQPAAEPEPGAEAEVGAGAEPTEATAAAGTD